MSKKMKLNLEELKVQSFVTSLKKEEKKEIYGGENQSNIAECTPGCENNK
jgi:hypothetical protein